MLFGAKHRVVDVSWLDLVAMLGQDSSGGVRAALDQQPEVLLALPPATSHIGRRVYEPVIVLKIEQSGDSFRVAAEIRVSWALQVTAVAAAMWATVVGVHGALSRRPDELLAAAFALFAVGFMRGAALDWGEELLGGPFRRGRYSR